MVIGATVNSINEASNWVFITMKSEDGTEMRLMLNKDDPRIEHFGFRQEVVIQIDPITNASKVRQIR